MVPEGQHYWFANELVRVWFTVEVWWTLFVCVFFQPVYKLLKSPGGVQMSPGLRRGGLFRPHIPVWAFQAKLIETTEAKLSTHHFNHSRITKCVTLYIPFTVPGTFTVPPHCTLSRGQAKKNGSVYLTFIQEIKIQVTLGGTHSLSSSFMSSNAPRSITVIWFSISCLQREDRNRALEKYNSARSLVLIWRMAYKVEYAGIF